MYTIFNKCNKFLIKFNKFCFKMRGKKINALIFRALIFKRNFLFYSVDFDSTTVLGSTLRMSPCNTLPGPSSVNSVTPSESMLRTM